MKKIIMLIAILAFGPNAHSVEVATQSRILVEIRGIVCSFCAYGLEKNLSRLQFIDDNHFKDGVLVDIKEGFITLAVDPAKPIDFAKIKKKIKKSGYDLFAIYLKLIGPVTQGKKGTAITNEANDQSFPLLNAKGEPWSPKDATGTKVSLQGIVRLDFIDEKQTEVPVEVAAFETIKPTKKDLGTPSR